MNLYLVSQDLNQDYDTYDSAVVAAESPEEAALEVVKVEYLGTAEKGTEKGVICASFNGE